MLSCNTEEGVTAEVVLKKFVENSDTSMNNKLGTCLLLNLYCLKSQDVNYGICMCIVSK